MKIKQITLGDKPCFIGIGNHETGYGHFIAYPFGRNVRADYLLGGFWSNVFKSITAEAVCVELDTDELKPFTEYFAPMHPGQKPGTATYLPAGDIPMGVKVIKNYPNESAGPRFDHYYAKPATGLSGENLNATALALHFLMHHVEAKGWFGGWILNDKGEIVQPLIFALEYVPREDQESPYRLKVNVINFAGNKADLRFSIDGIEWDESPEVLYLNPAGKAVFVQDSAGTKAAAPLNPANWPMVPVVVNEPE